MLQGIIREVYLRKEVLGKVEKLVIFGRFINEKECDSYVFWG